jgi:diguanylate cyclase (GGDEF)-like protein
MTVSVQKSGQSLARQLFYSHLLIALAVALLIGLYFYRAAEGALVSSQSETLRQIAASIAQRLDQPGQAINAVGLENERQALTDWLTRQRGPESRIQSFSLWLKNADGQAKLFASAPVNPDGKVSIEAFKQIESNREFSMLRSTPALFASMPFERHGQEVVVRVEADSRWLDEPLAELRRNAGLGFIIAVLLSLVAGRVLAFRARRILGRLINYCKLIAEGHFDRKIALRGSDEFLELGVAFDEMASRLKQSLSERDQSLTQLRSMRDQLEQNVKERTQELERINVLLRSEAEQRSRLEAALAEAAGTDPLTKLLNRRGMLELIDHMVERMKKQARFFCLVVIDIDHFKRINDHYGHGMGDRVLAAVASLLKAELKSDEAAARWGGEEFLLLWPDTSITASEHRANRIRELVASRPPVPDGPTVTLSAGVSEFTGLESVDVCLTKADRALYRAKDMGRNRVEVSL